MSDAYRAGKYHAETDQPSNLAFYTPHTFAWFDYLEGLSAGYNEKYWTHTDFGNNDAAHKYFALREEVKAKLFEALR